MTDLEKILSNLVKFPQKLVGIEIPQMTCMSTNKDLPEIEFRFTTVPDYHSDYKPPKDPDDDIPFCDMVCSECDMCNSYEEDFPAWGIPDVEYIIFNPPATIVFWEDGTKTVVKAMEGEKFEKYAGFMAACMKKMFGSTSRAKAIMNECDEDNWKQMVEDQKPKNPEPKQKPKKEKNISVSDLTEAFSYVLKQFADRKEEKDGTPTE